MNSSWRESGHPVFLAGLGASTSLGRDAASSAAAVRAGVSALTRHPYMLDTAAEAMRVARAPWLDLECDIDQRFEELLFPAVEQALALLGAARVPRLALVLALPPQRPGVPEALDTTLRAALARRFEHLFSATATFSVGHASGLVGLQAAVWKMAEGAFDGCVVAGVDSYLTPETLEWLEANEQMHGAGPRNNAWGFVPGEGAGAALLLTGDAVDRIGIEPMARLLSVATALEEKRIKTQTVCTGEGLTAAFRDGLKGLPAGARVTDIYCDMNGEPYRADEFGFAALRTGDAFTSVSEFVAPADCWGDVGAASAPLGMMLATTAGRKSYGNGPHAFVWASSESGERGAALLEVAVSAEV
jgi:3-oxoacyl-[acyl-carrier-protein] synthase-1